MALAVVASSVAYLAFADQKEINKSQLELNRKADERSDRRYASRVAWWAESDSPGVVSIQNRSPAPLSRVYIGPSPDWVENWRKNHKAASPANPELEGIYIWQDIPPCVVVQVRVPGATSTPPRNMYLPFAMQLYFQDQVGGWVRSDRGLTLLASPHHLEKPGRRDILGRDEVDDCGEGG